MQQRSGKRFSQPLVTWIHYNRFPSLYEISEDLPFSLPGDRWCTPMCIIAQIEKRGTPTRKRNMKKIVSNCPQFTEWQDWGQSPWTTRQLRIESDLQITWKIQKMRLILAKFRLILSKTAAYHRHIIIIAFQNLTWTILHIFLNRSCSSGLRFRTDSTKTGIQNLKTSASGINV